MLRDKENRLMRKHIFVVMFVDFDVKIKYHVPNLAQPAEKEVA